MTWRFVCEINEDNIISKLNCNNYLFRPNCDAPPNFNEIKLTGGKNNHNDTSNLQFSP